MKYAVIKDGIVENVIVADPSFAEKLGAVELSGPVNIGDGYRDGKFFPQKTAEQIAKEKEIEEYNAKGFFGRMMSGIFG